ncbi:hypothetical protein [Tolypothrix sp. NIES-4075]|uniref:hypothetical protein n=1 Tax=Tolypothrix sp. NIES-4075 TaxID=2005459 RepID=UPI00117FFED1|nr:hypothetical protein [Tolypothrix sp. NIES-4075]
MKHKVLINWFFPILIGYRAPMTQSFVWCFQPQLHCTSLRLLSIFLQVHNESDRTKENEFGDTLNSSYKAPKLKSHPPS